MEILYILNTFKINVKQKYLVGLSCMFMFIHKFDKKTPPPLSHMPTPVDCSEGRERKFYQLPFFIIQTDRKTQLSLRIQTRNEKQLCKLLLVLRFFREDAPEQGTWLLGRKPAGHHLWIRPAAGWTVEEGRVDRKLLCEVG